jgi:hypothetical protein
MHSPAVRSLHRELMKIASSFKDRNFRVYFSRIIEDDFSQFDKRSGADEAQFLRDQQAHLDILQRQVPIQNMYYSENFSVKR